MRRRSRTQKTFRDPRLCRPICRGPQRPFARLPAPRAIAKDPAPDAPLRPRCSPASTGTITGAQRHDGWSIRPHSPGAATPKLWRPRCEALVLQEADEDAPPHRGPLDIARIEGRDGAAPCPVRPCPPPGGGDATDFSGSSCSGTPMPGSSRSTGRSARLHPTRGCVSSISTGGGRPLRLIGVASGSLSQALRIVQMAHPSRQHVLRRDDRPTILCGDSQRGGGHGAGSPLFAPGAPGWG